MQDYTLDDLLSYKAQVQSPKKVVLCGSTRFMQAFQEANLRETLAGHIVLSIGCDTKSDVGLALTEEDKLRLGLLHLYKIDLADEVLILNVGGYIGASTRRELIYVAQSNRLVRFLEPEHLATDVCSSCGCLYCWSSDELSWRYEASHFAPCGCLWRFVLRLHLVQPLPEEFWFG